MKNLSELNLDEKKVIIFDLDGTLIDSIGVWNMTDHKMIKIYAGKEIDEDFIQTDRDRFFHENISSKDIYLDYFSYLIEKYGFSITNPNKVSIIRGNMANAILGNDIGFKEGAVDLIFKLKEAHKVLALATSSSAKQLEVYYKDNQKMLSQMNILDTFDLIIKKEDVKNMKPDPEIYIKIINYCGVTPKECLAFEDSYTGVLAATRAGIEVVNIYDKYADLDRDKINAITDYSIKSYEVFTNKKAKEIYFTPPETRDGVKRMIKKTIDANIIRNPYNYIAK